MAEILSDTAPTRPSQVHTADARAREIDADLDNILLMALRKEPQRRYGSVEQFANDLRNYLGGLPVQARGNALRYRLGKFLRRRKVEIAAAAVVVAVADWRPAVSRCARRASAEHQRVVAQRHFDSVRKLANTMLFALHDEIEPLRRFHQGARDAGEDLARIPGYALPESGSDRSCRKNSPWPTGRWVTSRARISTSNTGDAKGALQSYARSVALLEPLVAADPRIIIWELSWPRPIYSRGA